MAKLEIISRQEAIKQNLKRYFTGIPCKRGHISERWTGAGCIACDYSRREYHREYDRKFRGKNSPARVEYMKEYSIGYREKNKDKKKAYDYENKLTIQANARKSIKKRNKIDPAFKLRDQLRDRMKKFINKGKMKKIMPSTSKFAKEVIGLTHEELIKYIEKQFYPHPKTGEKMSWKNHTIDGWHVDHIKPVNSFDLTKLAEQKKCFHYTNLQPLWAEENLKKSDNY